MSTSPTAPKPRKQLSSSILLWVRNDQPRQTGMDYWKGPHSGIISANPGLKEYRQIHLAEDNPGRWPATERIETHIPHDRKIDGIAEVTLRSALSVLQGRKQNAMAYKDEINVSAAPSSMPGSRAHPAGTTSPPARRSGRTRSSTCVAATAWARAHSARSSPGIWCRRWLRPAC